MSNASSYPTRPRSSSQISSISTQTPTISRRPSRPPALSLSPLSSFQATPSQASTSPRYRTFSQAASVAGSSAPSVSVGGVTRFKRGHARKKVPMGVRSMNPDELDLMTLEDPNEPFRLFGVRDVRGLEKRASDAAAAKVAELRTMVGERYRDLLSAADSIVRMRSASEKLVDSLDKVDSIITGVNGDFGDTPTKKGRAPKLISRRSLSPDPTIDRTLASPPTLSLTIHLLLSLPSLVHTLLETSQYLPAARLEGVGRVVYRELSDYQYKNLGGDDDDEEGEKMTALKDAFPIIEKQWEAVASLNKVIVRRAMGELRVWDADATTTAETLSSIHMLENSTLSSSLTLLLSARSKSLSATLDAPPELSKHPHHDVDEVLANLSKVLGIVLRTVQSAEEIFGTEGQGEGLLKGLLKEIENPSGSGVEGEDGKLPRLVPALSTLPDYTVLARHLPPSILSFTPFLSIDSDRNQLTPKDAKERIDSWLATESRRVVEGVKAWISDLRGGARTLAKVRKSVRESLSASKEGAELKKQLEKAIESRLEIVYTSHLSSVVSRVPTCLSSLLASLPTSESDQNSSHFLFEQSLAFPQPNHYSLPKGAAGKNDPFKMFLENVMKRVEGKSPLVERGLGELEAHARELREDLEGWLGGEEEDGEVIKARLREQYVNSARETLDGVHTALSQTLDGLTSDVTGALFLGNFACMLARSKTFTSDLLLGAKPLPNSEEGMIVSAWLDRLAKFQQKSLESWRKEAVEQAVEDIEMSTKNVGSSRWVVQASSLSIPSSSPPLPFQPSSAILGCLRNLVIAIRRVGPHRTQSDPSITRSLLADFEAKCLPIAKALVGTLEGLDEKIKKQVASQAAWDVVFLERFWAGEKKKEWSEVVKSIVKVSGQSSDITDYLTTSTLSYLQRSQTIFSILLPSLATPATNGKTSTVSTTRLLPWGAPASSAEFKSTIGVVKPGVRLGLLPTRS